MNTAILKAGRDKSLRRRHPWIFSGAVKKMIGNPLPGETVAVRGTNGDFLALAAFSPASQIRLRVWSFEDQAIDRDFFRKRLKQAIALRQALHLLEPGTACRLVNAEADGLPGLVIDRYDDFLVIQVLAAGAEFFKDVIVRELGALLAPQGIYERSDAEVRKKEGLPLRTGLLAGREPPEYITIREDDRLFLVDVRLGHKTGFYLDQRENRQLLKNFVQDAAVLNCFCYTGGFGVAAVQGGAAALVNVDSSAVALAIAKRNAALNRLSDAAIEYLEADVFKLLRTFRDSTRRFDCIILDPPKFAESKQQIERSARGYKDINLLAFKLLKPGGRLFTFSCSGLIEPPLFQKIVADAALDAGREVRLLHHLEQAADHPAALCFPEGTYLKGLVCLCS